MNTLTISNLGNLAHRVMIGAVLFFFAHAGFAAPTSEEQAGSAVQTWLDATGRRPLHTSTGNRVQRVFTQSDEDGQPLYHVVFLTDDGVSTKGFVVTGGDDEEEPIMAISSASAFGTTPEDPLFALLNKHASEVSQQLHVPGPRAARAQKFASGAKSRWKHLLAPKAGAAALNPSVVSGSTSAISDVRVAPLLQSTWNQSTSNNFVNGPACYNYYTPPNAVGSSSNYVCGCVATAVGQVMRFWQYPTTSVGTAKFPIQVSGVSKSWALLGGDGAGGPYQWSSMPLTPGTSITTTQAQAIGALIHDVALAANTNFTSNGSSGYLNYAVTELTDTFHYANSVDVFAMDAISTQSLVTMITPSLDAGSPVCIAFEENGGHALVCDGYGYNSGVLYHHLNFGWGGADDVWYALPDANTDNGDFSTVDECSFNIFPNIAGEIISGRVTDGGGNPIAGVSVSAVVSGGTASYTATTGTNGIYALKGVPASKSFTVSAQLSGHAFTSQGAATGKSSSGPLGSGYSNPGSFGSVSGINFIDVQNSAALTVTASPSNAGTVAGAGTFAVGSSHQISATANAGWAFSSWSDSVTTNPRTVTVPDGGVTYTAVFTQLPGAQITGPANGSTLTSGSATFTWSAGPGATQYSLWLGTAPNTSGIYTKVEGTALKDTVNVPVNGSKIYATLWEMFGGQWVATGSSTYTAWTAPVPVKARIISPANDATLWAKVTFSWDAGKNATQYLLRVGSTPLGSDIFSKVEGKNLKAMVTLPMDGRRLYVTIYSMINGQWQPNSYTYTAGTTAGLPIAALASPAEGSTFGSPQVTFRWSSCTRATNYCLAIGTAPGKADLFGKALGKVLTAKVTMPSDGSPVYVSVMSLVNKKWQYSRTYTFKSYTNPSPTGTVKAVLTSPTNSTTLTGASTTFTWSQGKGATQYQLLIGSALGQSDIYSNAEGTALTDIVALPTDGRPLYVTLQSYINGQWVSNNYIYTAYTAAGWDPAEITSPADNTAFTGAQVAFNWTACTRATQYELCVGSYPGASDLYAKMEGTALTDTLTMPVDGSPVYVTLLSYINGSWQPSESYIYRAFGP